MIITRLIIFREVKIAYTLYESWSDGSLVTEAGEMARSIIMTINDIIIINIIIVIFITGVIIVRNR